MKVRIELLSDSHDRTAFDCGKLPLNHFLQQLAGQYARKNLARTFVAIPESEARIIGYYSLAMSAISLVNLTEEVAKKLPKHPVPAVLLARLAVDRSMHGQGLGRRLIGDALIRCLQISEQIGTHSVIVDAIDDEAVQFYLKMGFTQFRDQRDKLFIPLAKIRPYLPA